MPATETLAEAERVMTICNACRYCEGHCAVFPAMEMRLAFSAERELWCAAASRRKVGDRNAM